MSACDKNVFEKGLGICIVDGHVDDIEAWVQKVAQRSGQRMDWHYAVGRAHVLYIGDYQAVRGAVEALAPALVGRIIRIYPPEFRARPSRPPAAVTVDRQGS